MRNIGTASDDGDRRPEGAARVLDRGGDGAGSSPLDDLVVLATEGVDTVRDLFLAQRDPPVDECRVSAEGEGQTV